MTFNFAKLRSPLYVFFIYVAVSSVLIMVFRFIFPGSEAPLWIYQRDWRYVKGFLEVFNLFPALAFSALVIPFGFVSTYEEQYQSFSEMFFKRLATSIIIAIFTTVIYCIIFFIASPMMKNREESMRFNGELYREAKNLAFEKRASGDWQEVYQLIGICDSIWPNSPDFTELRIDVDIHLDDMRYEEGDEWLKAQEALTGDRRYISGSADLTPLSGSQQLLNATQAIEMGRKAFEDRQYFDAHWLATLGSRLSLAGSAQAASAARLASEAWNMITTQEPSRLEEYHLRIYNLKLSGYQAMNTGDWIRAFYIFQELLKLTPDDPDAINFYAASERGAKEYAFFVDEMEMTLGDVLTSSIFSLPAGYGRAVLRFTSFKSNADVGYGTGLEYMSFDENARPLTSVRSNYAKIIPFSANNKMQVLILTHALTRYDKDSSWDSEWLLGEKTPGGILLDVTYEDLVMLSHVRHGLGNLQIFELFDASKELGSLGYVSQIFEAEILNRINSVIFFLPMAVFVIVLAWRYRAVAKPRYLFILLILILPVVFHGFVFLYRSMLNTLGIWLIISFGFTAALVICIAALGVIFFISLITLAAQHS
jgi:tetratricopeptide (TPR) repeat protein